MTKGEEYVGRRSLEIDPPHRRKRRYKKRFLDPMKDRQVCNESG